MNNSFDIPILLITFNRPENTSVVLEQIKKNKPSKLYVFSDAPRHLNSKDIVDVAQTRSLFNNIDWNCKVYKLFMEKNLGCGLGVSGAIDWVFEREEMVIILEDDCVPNPSFFDFCRIMLLKFKDDPKVMHVSGTRWNPEYNIGDCNYFFSRIGHIWGWATWRRAWKKYDYYMSSWGKNSISAIRTIFKNRLLSQFWIESFTDIYKLSKKHTWDIQWQYTLLIEKGLAVVPHVNLISNIGTNGTHTGMADENHFFRKTEEWVDKNIDCCSITAHEQFDTYHIKCYFMKYYFLKQKLKLYYKSYTN